MQKFINQILTEIHQIEIQLHSSLGIIQFETIISQLIYKTYQLIEYIEEIQNDFSLKEEQFKYDVQQKQEEITLTLKELDKQKQCVVILEDQYQKLEEQSTSNQLSYDLQIQGLQSKLKESELSQVSLKLNFDETITQFKEYLYKKDLAIEESNMKLQTLIEQCQSNNSQTNTTSHKQCDMKSIVSLQNLEIVEQENIFEISEKSNEENCEIKAKKGQSYNSLKIPSMKQMSKLINSKCELDDQLLKFGTQQLNSQFVSKLHTRHNSYGNTFNLNQFSIQKELTLIQRNEINKQRNIYQDFFQLISQCVKLDLKNNKIFTIEVNHLYDEFIKNNVPFNKWYQSIQTYLTQQE